MMSPQEHAAAVAAGRGATRALPDVAGVVGLVQWRRYPALAARVAGFCRAVEARRGAPVAVCLERGWELNAAMLGILASGAILVPIDPALPDVRIGAILADAGVRSVVADTAFADRAIARDSRSMIASRCFPGDPMGPRDAAAPGDPAYLLYTSGSSGQPKGVAVPHRALVNHAVAVVDRYGLHEADRILQMAAPGFDVYLEELIPTLVAGAALVPLPGDAGLDPAAFLRFVAEHELTILNLPTAYWSVLAGALTGGLACRPRCGLSSSVASAPGRRRSQAGGVQRFRRGSSTLMGSPRPRSPRRLGRTMDRRLQATDIPVAWPLANQDAHVLDRRRQPVPAGARGTLWVGGRGLALGYWRAGGIDDRSTLIDLGGGPLRLLETGDLARRRSDGAIEISAGATSRSRYGASGSSSARDRKPVLERHPRRDPGLRLRLR